MRILLDENLPHDLRHYLPGHEVFTVVYMTWTSLKNGELLKVAGEANFDVLITRDAGLEYQQNAMNLPISVLALAGPANSLADILPLVTDILLRLLTLKPKTLARVARSDGPR